MGDARRPCLLLGVILRVGALAAAAPGLLREHRSTKGREANSAVLNANGGYVMENRRANAHKAHWVVTKGSAPNCQMPCDMYEGGADRHTEEVCFENGICKLMCQSGAEMCSQWALEDCSKPCSEWANGDTSTVNVCQETASPWKCIKKDACVAGNETRCRQPEIPLCPTTCDGYDDTASFSLASQDSQMVCQDETGFPGKCYGLPCTGSHPQPSTSRVCRQVFSQCENPCEAGSTHDNTWQVIHQGNVETVVCRNTVGVCSSAAECPVGNSRCFEVHVYQDVSNVHSSKPYTAR